MAFMKTETSASDDKGSLLSPEIISHCVWLYVRFSLNYRDVMEIMALRGIVLTYETVRQCASHLVNYLPMTCVVTIFWCSDKWHMDEVVLTIRGKADPLNKQWIKTATCSTPGSESTANSSKD
jgi:putative transposase